MSYIVKGGEKMDENSLNRYYANLNTIMYNLLNFHWNVTGGLFLTLHQLYQDEAQFLFNSILQLAETIKGEELYPLTCLHLIYDAADIKTMESKDYTARETIENSIHQFASMKKLALELNKLANDANSYSLMDFLTHQITYFNKQLYLLRQFLK